METAGMRVVNGLRRKRKSKEYGEDMLAQGESVRDIWKGRAAGV